jgi:hypothetical protein
MVGGIKKKFQINALNNAESMTGKMSKSMALRETTNNKIRATTLYPKTPTEKKHRTAVSTMSKTVIRY